MSTPPTALGYLQFHETKVAGVSPLVCRSYPMQKWACMDAKAHKRTLQEMVSSVLHLEIGAQRWPTRQRVIIRNLQAGIFVAQYPANREVSMAAYRSPAVDLTGSPARNDLRPPPRPQCSQVDPAADRRQRSHEAIDLIGSPARNDLRPPPRPVTLRLEPGTSRLEQKK